MGNVVLKKNFHFHPHINPHFACLFNAQSRFELYAKGCMRKVTILDIAFISIFLFCFPFSHRLFCSENPLHNILENYYYFIRVFLFLLKEQCLVYLVFVFYYFKHFNHNVCWNMKSQIKECTTFKSETVRDKQRDTLLWTFQPQKIL